MRKYLLLLLSLFALNVNILFAQDVVLDDLLGVNTNMPNPAVVKSIDIPVLKISVVGLPMFSSDVELYGSNITKKINQSIEAWDSGINPQLFSNIKDWVIASKTHTPMPQKISMDLVGVKMIAEVVTPNNSEEERNQEDELIWAKTQGYNSVLLVWRGESPLRLSLIASTLKASGWRVFFAYSPSEGTLFDRTPTQIQEAASLILPNCDAAFLGWRSTSIPHFSGMPTSYYKVIGTIYRNVKSDIPLIGETFIQNSSIDNLDYSGKSATLLVNIGYTGVQGKAVAGYLSTTKKEGPFMVLVIGKVPYYDTVKMIKGYTSKQAVLDKQQIEKNFSDAGFSTVTLVGDGYGERTFNGQPHSDSLTHSQLRNLK